MIHYVVDTSVAAKWFLPPAGENLTPEACHCLKEFSAGRVGLVVPDLFWPELGNVLWKAVRLKRMSRAMAEESIEAAEQLGLATTPSKPLLRDAFAIAATVDRTVYDSVYMALAIVSGAPFLTADERLANALATRFPVRWLGAQY